ncbi:MAG: PAS domain-containing protein [Vicinamibacterales bacterium]
MSPLRTRIVATSVDPSPSRLPAPAPDGLARLDRDGRVGWMNTACVQLFGAADLATLVNRSSRALVAPDAAAAADAFLARVFDGEPGTFEFELAGARGTWLAMHATRCWPTTRSPQGAVLADITHDITDRRQADALLRWVEGSARDHRG